MALVTSLVLLAVALAVTLTRSPPTVAWSDFTPLNGTFATVGSGARACQAHETLPRGATAMRFSLYSLFGPRVRVKVLSGVKVLASGTRGNGWVGESPTVPLTPVQRDVSDVTLCFSIGSTFGRVSLDGIRAAPAGEVVSGSGQTLPGRMRVEFLKPGDRSWLSLSLSVARRAGLGRWPAGTWTVLLEAMLAVAVLAGASWLLVKELR